MPFEGGRLASMYLPREASMSDMTRTPFRRRVRRWLREAAPTAAALLILLAARSSLADQYVVPSGSMEATLQVGDHILVDKRAYGWRLPFTDIELLDGAPPRAGEVVIFDSPSDGTRLVKRVVATAGDRVAVRGGRLWRNGAWADEPYADLRSGPGPDLSPRVVPPGQILVMGDHRGNSNDGRMFGYVPADAVYGRVLGVFWRASRPAWAEVEPNDA